MKKFHDLKTLSNENKVLNSVEPYGKLDGIILLSNNNK